MKLSVDLSALHRAVAPLGQVTTDFSITSRASELESISSHLNSGMILGEDIQLEDIDGSNGVLSFNGQQVMLYIPDQGNLILNVLRNGKQKGARRVHVAECKTIIGMRERGRFNDRYDVISRVDGRFPVFGYDAHTCNEVRGEADLAVCQNCLELLNYNNFSQLAYGEKSHIVTTFSYETLFENYTSYFNVLPKSIVGFGSGNYTDDWSVISAKLRSEEGYLCEQCGVDLSQDSRLLHVHHINGNKANNHRENLRVLCADCHKKQPHHEHLFVSHDDILLINQRRKEQHKFDAFNYEKLFKYADTALDGFLKKCQSVGLPMPDLGISVGGIAIDLCWPRRKVAILINMADVQVLQQHGWTVFKAFDALNDFESIQRTVR